MDTPIPTHPLGGQMSPPRPSIAQAEGTLAQLPLFRTEAMAARQTSWLGRPHVGQPWPVRAVANGSLAAALGVICLITFGSYTRRVTVQGVIAPTAGIVRVMAPSA